MERQKCISPEVQFQELYDYEGTHLYVKILHLLIETKVLEQFTSWKVVRLCHVYAKACTTEQSCLDCDNLVHG